MRIFSRLMLSTALLGTVAAPAMAQGVVAPVHRAIPHVHTVAAVQPAPVAALPGVVATAPAMPGPATTTAPMTAPMTAPVTASTAKPTKPDVMIPATPTARSATQGAARVN